MNTPKISAVICTHNRCAFLLDALHSLQEQSFPKQDYEIIVVDNASTDDTRAVVEQIKQNGYPPIRYIYEAQVGLSQARNTAAHASQSDLIAYIDDDALADPEWLGNLATAYQNSADTTGCIAGSSVLRWEGNRPKWFPKELEGYLSSTSHLGTQERILKPDEFPVGTNFSVRKQIWLETGGFDLHLGRSGKNLLSGEETELCQRIRAAGKQILFAPQANVQHRILEDRVKAAYFLKRAYWQGITDAILFLETSTNSRIAIIQRCIIILFEILKDGMRAALNSIALDPQRAFFHCFTAAERAGWIRQLSQSLVPLKNSRQV